MFDKLDFILEKYEELSLKVSDPDIINNQPLWQKYIKEMGEMEPIVNKYREYKKAKEGVQEAKEMLESGEITEEQARNHPRKNIITRALGVDDTVVVDYFEIPFEEHAKLLLCSDGFSGSLTPERIYHFSRGLTAERITQRAIELAKEAGGNDNITVITISR